MANGTIRILIEHANEDSGYFERHELCFSADNNALVLAAVTVFGGYCCPDGTTFQELLAGMAYHGEHLLNSKKIPALYWVDRLWSGETDIDDAITITVDVAKLCGPEPFNEYMENELRLCRNRGINLVNIPEG